MSADEQANSPGASTQSAEAVRDPVLALAEEAIVKAKAIEARLAALGENVGDDIAALLHELESIRSAVAALETRVTVLEQAAAKPAPIPEAAPAVAASVPAAPAPVEAPAPAAPVETPPTPSPTADPVVEPAAVEAPASPSTPAPVESPVSPPSGTPDSTSSAVPGSSAS